MGGENALFNGSWIPILIGTSAMTAFIIAILGCSWCRKKWKKFSEQRHSRFSGTTHLTCEVPRDITTEFTIFPPQSSDMASVNTEEVVFEPLPEIRGRSLKPASQNIRPARFTGSSRKVSLQDWFDEQQYNFPRNQLKYLREVGSSWYGQAIEGEADNILPNKEKSEVVVKILRVDASASELMQFLHETRPFRDLLHPNLLRLLGRCLEVHPFLLIMEHCPMDLKTCLIEQRKSPEMLLKNGLLLRMACNITSALQYMHEHGYIHTDIATHSCLVSSDLIVKIGDYGTALHTYKEDYYCLGDIAFPLRWCAPESLYCTETAVEARDITREANIWSFGILLWELLEFGKLPYTEFNDEEVLQKVIIDFSMCPEQPKTPCVHKDMIFKIMQLCWQTASHRPTIQKVSALLSYLYDNRDTVPESVAFESRWNSLQPAIRDHSLQNVNMPVVLRFESDFTLKAENGNSRDSDSVLSSDFDPVYSREKSPSHGSISTGYEGEFNADISPSLQNLRGSIEDLSAFDEAISDNELDYGSKVHLDESSKCDVTQQQVNDAIENLDNILAGEVTSSETSKCTTPDAVHPTNQFESIGENSKERRRFDFEDTNKVIKSVFSETLQEWDSNNVGKHSSLDSEQVQNRVMENHNGPSIICNESVGDNFICNSHSEMFTGKEQIAVVLEQDILPPETNEASSVVANKT